MNLMDVPVILLISLYLQPAEGAKVVPSALVIGRNVAALEV